jgi:two-component system sensor histidine kinase TtrS
MPYLLLIAALLIAVLPPPVQAQQTVTVGVLSHRGNDKTHQAWDPTAHYLSQALPGYQFEILPMPFDAVEQMVAGGGVDFVLVNPGIYVELEVAQLATRIATLRNTTGGPERNQFGSVIFTRSDDEALAHLHDLRDLRHKRLMAVDPRSLGGFEMAWAELAQAGIDPFQDPKSLTFAGTHDAVVEAVRAGRADAGIVRTGILERMAGAGAIDLEHFRVLNLESDPNFALLRSTPLYPEWPFSVVNGTSPTLADAVAIALLKMPPDGPAARAGGYAGWTVPLDYQSVHDLLRTLHRPPYDRPVTFTLRDALSRYWLPVALGALALLVMALLTGRVNQLNRRLSRAKSQLELRQALILDSVAEGIYGVDLDGRTTFVNRALERMTGWTAEDLLGEHQHEVLHHTHADGEPHPRDQCPICAPFEDDTPRLMEDEVFWRRDGTCFPVEYSATPLRDDHGRVIGTVVVFRDITERRAVAERIHRSELEQAHMDRLSTLGEMASGIAHELNQPLTAISTNARACVRILESGRGNLDLCCQVIGRIADQADRAGEIIRQIRRFAHKEPPQMEPTAVWDMFDSVLTLLDKDARRAGVHTQRDVGSDAQMVLAQRILIEQVLMNLVRNAIEAMEDQQRDRRLLLLARRRDDRVEIRVVDTGPGLDPSTADRLFEPFVTTKPNGLGVGLSISTGIVQAHGGNLRVDSTPGIGATFYFSLEATEPDGSHDKPSPRLA